jgi:hypothetical protein
MPRIPGVNHLPGFEEEAIGRAVDYDMGQERVVRLCPQCDGNRRWLEEFARITDDREIVARFERAWASRRRA